MTRIFLLFVLVGYRATGQVLEFLPPEKLGMHINSEAEESSPLLSPDGKALYFVRALSTMNVGGKMGGSDIWISQAGADGRWLPATRAPRAWNNRESNATVGVRKDGRVLYLLNAYTSRGGVAFSTRLGSEWTAPEIIPIPGLEKSTFVGFYMDPEFSTLLISMKKLEQQGEEDLYVSTRDSLGSWSAPLHLGPTINTEGFEISPFLSADKTKLYFASNGHDGLGDADIYVSTRLYGSWTVWTKPVNLGPSINSEKFDAYYATYGDSVSFFASNRDSDFADIYQVAIRQKSRVDMKDSVERIVRETQRLLSEMGSIRQPGVDVKYVVFNENSAELPAQVASELNGFLARYKAKLKQLDVVVPISGEDIVLKRTANLVDFLANHGVPRHLIKSKRSTGNSNKNVFLLEIMIEN